MFIKNVKKLMLCFFSMFMTSSIFAENNSVNIAISHWQLKNKTAVYFVQRKELPMLDIAVLFKAGSVYDEKLPGLSSLTNEMIGEGAKNLSANKIAELFEGVGAQFDANSNRDMAVVHLRTMTQKPMLDDALKTFQTVLDQPTFPITALQRIKKQALTSLALEDQNPWNVAKNEFYKELYRSFPYAHNPLGDKDSINKISRNDILEFYQRYYTGKNARVIIVGDISQNQAKDISQEIVGKLPPGISAPTLKLPKSQLLSAQKHVIKQTHQATIVLGQIGISPDNAQYFPLLVGNAILGGLPLTSILYQQIRDEKGLAYFANSSFEPLEYRGTFMIGLQTKASNQSAVISLLNHILKTFIKDGPTDAQLSAAKKNLIGRFPLSIASNESIMRVLTKIVFYNYPSNYLDTYKTNVNAVTADDIKVAFQKTINPEKLTYVTVGPKN